MVSCGSYRMSDDCFMGERNRPYNKGCNGGTGYATMLYLRDHGLTWASCYPYALSGNGDGAAGGTGNLKVGAGVLLKDLPSCKTSCTESFTAQYPTIPMTFFKGVAPRSIIGEVQMKQAIMDGGPISCTMQTYNSFSLLRSSQIYTVELGTRKGDYLNKDGGYHAVVIYGWGVEMADEWTMSDVSHSHPALPGHTQLLPRHRQTRSL
jgi:hypothetical protein